MTIKFSMDRIKNMDQLYTWTPTYSEELGCPGEEEHYHGTDYCKQVIADVFATMNWGTQKYLGSLERIANEVFKEVVPGARPLVLNCKRKMNKI